MSDFANYYRNFCPAGAGLSICGQNQPPIGQMSDFAKCYRNLATWECLPSMELVAPWRRVVVDAVNVRLEASMSQRILARGTHTNYLF